MTAPQLTARLRTEYAGKRSPYNRTLADVQRALEESGIVFLPDNGVKLSPRRTAAKKGR
jgi:hypothetical protein